MLKNLKDAQPQPAKRAPPLRGSKFIQRNELRLGLSAERRRLSATSALFQLDLPVDTPPGSRRSANKNIGTKH